MTELELLAPARNTDIGIAAIDCGADAVYIAADEFGARQAAGNSIENIKRLCDYAHQFGARIFVTVNTIMYDDELTRALETILAIQDAGADAIIVQDMAVIAMIRDKDKRITIPVHASTQCAIRTPEKAAAMEALGFSRVILEREMSLDQIRQIRSSINCEMEFFVHGALCVCYSGQCYLSELVANRSANRGACVQACRSRYDLLDDNGNVLVRDKALLSLKDYKLLDSLEELANAGISSFKIEGRLKNISYVRNVVRAYSLALDRIIMAHPDQYCRASFGSSRKGFTPDTDKTFNRGYTELFIHGKRGQWASMDAAKGMGEEIGTILKTDKKKTHLTLALNKHKNIEIHNGDGFSFIAPKGEIIGFRGDVCKGNEITCHAIPEIHEGMRIYRNLDTAFEKEMERNACKREINVNITLSIIKPSVINPSDESNEGQFSLKLSASSEDGRNYIKEFTTNSEPANNLLRMEEMITTQLSKTTGIYRFNLQTLNHDGSLPFMSASELNTLRREAAEALDAEPCHLHPLRNNTLTINSVDSKSQKSIIEGIASDKKLSYKSNVANKWAEQVYREAGAESIDKAYELSHIEGAELMRTKYCIRHELGMCLKKNPSYKGKLYLLNNGKKLMLNFDCKNCEMIVSL